MKIQFASFEPLTGVVSFTSDHGPMTYFYIQVVQFGGTYDETNKIYSVEKSMLKAVLLDSSVPHDQAVAIMNDIEAQTNFKKLLKDEFPDDYNKLATEYNDDDIEFEDKAERAYRTAHTRDYKDKNTIAIIKLFKQGDLTKILKTNLEISQLTSITDGSGHSLIYWAVRMKHQHVIDCYFRYIEHSRETLSHSVIGYAILFGVGVAKIRKLYLEGNSLTLTGTEGFTALHIAAAENHVDVIRFILPLLSDEEISYITPKGATAIHLAARNGHVDVLTAMETRLKAEDINFFVAETQPPIIEAIQNKHSVIVEYLCNLRDSFDKPLLKLDQAAVALAFKMNIYASALDAMLNIINPEKKSELLFLLRLQNTLNDPKWETAGWGIFSRKKPFNIEEMQKTLTGFTAFASNEDIDKTFAEINERKKTILLDHSTRTDDVAKFYDRLIVEINQIGTNRALTAN